MIQNADVWVIVRCYNEAPVVHAVISDLRHVFPNVVGVDDGSCDGSQEAMLRAGARVVRHSINLGAGAALQTGIEFALLDPRAKYFVCFDADGQHRVTDAQAMVVRVRNGEFDILIGSRFLGDAAHLPAGRKLVLKAGRLCERLMSGISLTDAHNGLRVFNRQFASQVDLTISDMAYASELLSLIRRSGLRYGEHPVSITYTDYSLAKGQKSINSVNIATDLLVHSLGGRRRQ